jgi:hypothetical protein
MPRKRTGLVIDLNSALHIDLTLEVAGRQEVVTVTEVNTVAVEAASTQLGEVVTGKSMTAVALNGRSFTDLLALQPGIVPVSTQQPDSIVMAGVTVAIAPSGGLNPGNQSISGQREDANGFMVNGGYVKELIVSAHLPAPERNRPASQLVDRLFGVPAAGRHDGAAGFPVTIASDGDRSLQGSLPNGVNNRSLDRPDFTPGPLQLHRDPRSGLPYFNTSLFSPNAFGTPGHRLPPFLLWSRRHQLRSRPAPLLQVHRIARLGVPPGGL